MWSSGVILLSLITKRYPFFQSPDDLTSVIEISNLCGSENLIKIADKLGKVLLLPVNYPGVSWRDLVSKLNPTFYLDHNLLDLLSLLLQIDPDKRISAKDALSHPFIKYKL